jgi:Zn-dependent peptidase ImmA (M78 family)/transcriptional regulator with XRE-family HTH domain
MLKEIGRALAQARERSGLSQQAAAEAAGLSRVVLSYYETGARQPPLGVLVSLARLYATSLTGLLEGAKEPEATPRVPDVLFRAAPAELSDRAKAQARRFSDLADAYVELIEELDVAPPGRGTSPFPGVRPRASRRDAARLAREVRGFLGLGLGPINDLFRLVDEHVLVFRLALGSDLSEAPSGFFYNHPRAGFCVVVNSDMTLGRQVFTLAHELAHVFFHSQRLDVSISMPGASIERERFADLFAGEFLVPADALAGAIDELDPWEEISDPLVVVHLQRHFGVSYGALLVRLRQERYVTEEQYQQLRLVSPSALAQTLGYPVNPADLGDYELSPLDRFPDRMLRLVRAAIRQGRITLGDAAETLGVSVEDLRFDGPPAGAAERRALEDIEAVAHLG